VNAAELAIHFERRKSQSDKICAEPHNYKVCGVCHSIAFKQAGLCPMCHSYQWFENKLVVESVAKYSANFAFPQMAGVVPRLQPAKGDK